MTEKPRPRDPNYKWLVMIVVMVGMIMAMLDSSIVNVSIPTIMADFGANINDIEWVVTAYMLAFAVLMPLTTWLRDRIGHKFLYILSLGLFTGGSLLCGIAPNLPALIFARVIQALGGGAMTPTGMAMIAEVFEPKERGRAMGIFGITIVIGPAFGPTLGGFITMTFGWRWVFLINLPIGIICAMLAMAWLAHDRPHGKNHRSFDFWGFAFLSLFLTSFLLGLSRGETEGWTSRYILTCAALTIFGFLSFLITETLVRDKIMDIGLFRHAVFSVAMLISAIRSIALFGSIFLLPLFLQQLKGMTAIQSGLTLLPGSLVMAVAMPAVGWFSDRSSPRFLCFIGMSLMLISMLQYRNISIYMSNWQIVYPTMIRGVGMCFLMAPIMMMALNSVPKHKTGMASSMMSIIQQVGGAIGIAVLSTVLDNRTKFHLNAVTAAINTNSAAFTGARQGIMQRATELGYSHAYSSTSAVVSLMKFINVACVNFGFQDAFVFASALILLSIIPIYLLPNKHVIHQSQQEILEV